MQCATSRSAVELSPQTIQTLQNRLLCGVRDPETLMSIVTKSEYLKRTAWMPCIGEYGCDTPLALIESMLSFIPSVAPKIDFGILTGDVPPHEVWSTLPTIKTQLVEEESFALMHAHFDSPNHINTVLYPAVGNHESAPTNNFPLTASKIPIEKEKEYLRLRWLYNSLAISWRGWLTHRTTSDIEHNSGSYVAQPMKGLKLISLNTNFCYTLNLWLYERPIERVSTLQYLTIDEFSIDIVS